MTMKHAMELNRAIINTRAYLEDLEEQRMQALFFSEDGHRLLFPVRLKHNHRHYHITLVGAKITGTPGKRLAVKLVPSEPFYELEGKSGSERRLNRPTSIEVNLIYSNGFGVSAPTMQIRADRYNGCYHSNMEVRGAMADAIFPRGWNTYHFPRGYTEMTLNGGDKSTDKQPTAVKGKVANRFVK